VSTVFPTILGCPDGTTYDPVTGTCQYDPSYVPSCESGYYWDALQLECVPVTPVVYVQTQPTSSTSNTQTNTTSTGEPGYVTVTVNNSTNVTDAAVDQVASAVQGAIDQSASTAADIATRSAQTVSNAIGGLLSGVGSTIQSILSTIGGALVDLGKSILSNLGGLVSAIFDNIGPILSGIKDAVTSVISTVGSALNSVVSEIQQINDTFIQPITNVILGTINTISTLTTVIEKDLHDGLAGILSIPTDLANGLSSLDATFQRSIQQLSDANVAAISTQWSTMFDGTLGTPLKTIGDSITSATGSDQRTTTFSAHVNLPEPDTTQAVAASIAAVWEQVYQFATTFMAGGQSKIDALKSTLANVPFPLGDLVEIPVCLFAILGGIASSALPLLEFERGQAAALAGLAKLQPSDALAAYLRQFIDADTLRAELSFQGWDASRIQTMMDLQVQLLDVSSVIEMYVRGITTEDDTRANLLQHGFAPQDQDALLEVAFKVVDVGNAIRAWQYGNLDDSQLTAVLKQNRYTDNEVSLFLSTALNQEGLAEIIERHKRETLYSNHLTSDQTFLQTPGDVIAAARREGSGPDKAADAWLGQFAVPPLNQWLSLYFRGIRTLTEFNAACDYYRVPQEWRQDYIAANRALIPFRTIPTMLAAGIIDQTYAKQQLEAHGFDLQQVEALLSYAGISKKTVAATTASDLKSVSVGAARVAWQDGAITQDQYSQILAAHGYDADTVALTIKVQTLEQQIAERRSNAQDIINEALAGFITQADAAQQLANGGYTIAEQAKYVKQLHKAAVASAKLPSLAELKAFWKASIIDETTFRNTVASLGYSQTWVDAFSALYNPSATTVTPTVAQGA
jgi:hypothetical protein